MLVGDILNSSYEGIKVDLFDSENSEWLASYDGRDSIPSFYNKFEVKLIYVDPENTLCICI